MRNDRARQSDAENSKIGPTIRLDINIHEFSRQIEALREQVTALVGRSDELPLPEQHLLIRAFEELGVAEEELRQQHEELELARQMVEAERQRYQDLFELAPDGYLVTDAKGIIQEANRAAASLVNVSQQELVGKPLIIFVAGESRRDFYARLSELLHSKEPRSWEVEIQPRKGAIFPAAFRVVAARNFQGKVVNLRWLMQDISDRKRIEKERVAALTEAEAAAKRATFLAEASRILASSLDWRTTLTNVVNLAVPDFADWCFIDIIENDRIDLSEPVVAAANPEKAKLALELRRLYPPALDGDYGPPKVLRTGEAQLLTEIPDSISALSPQEVEHFRELWQLGAESYMVVPLIVQQRKLGTIAFVSARSKRRYSQADLAMALELAQRATIAIDHARLYREAQEANRLKDEFLAIVSHELRTPLNAIHGWSQILCQRKLNEQMTAKAVETIERNAKLQVNLIEDILDISRIVQGKIRLNIRPVSLGSVINAAIENVRPTAEIKDIQIETKLDPRVGQVLGDSERLQQVIWNLLSNAIKFTPASGRVEVRLEQVDSTAQITVSDTGKGISPDFVPHMFERFRQADSSTSRKYGGLGLGLAIVRHLVEMHSGTVFAASDGEGKGATFTVQLPIKELQPMPRIEEREVTLNNLPSLDGLRVLVVDDDGDSCELFTHILQERKAIVRVVNSAKEALDAIAFFEPDILVSDIGMPEEDGYSLIRKLRNLPANRGGMLPAIALTAFAREEERIRAIEAGFHLHLPKPVEPAELVTVVANLAQSNRSV